VSPATEAEQRARLAHIDLHAIVAAPGHHCLYPRHGEPCAGPGACTELDAHGNQPGFVCRVCTRWGETIESIPHTSPFCVVELNPAPVRKPRRSPLLDPAPKPAGYTKRKKR
jgi:hypothetical protein